MSGETPEVSVVIPLYDKAATVERAIRSVLAQTFRDFEVIVVNDGSTDEGPDIVRRIGDRRIRVIEQENAGVSAARNRGIAEARAELIAFLDADDEWKPCFLEEVQRLRAAHPAADVFATGYLFCDGEGRYSTPIIRGIPAHPWDGIIEDYFDVAARSDPPLWTSAVTVAKSAVNSVGGFPVGVNSGEDLLTWARLAARYEVAYSTLPCAVFWRPQSVNERPRRHVPGQDVVGRELRRLLKRVEPTRRPSLCDYLLYWHKSRASTYLEFGVGERALRELRFAARYGRMGPKFWAYLVCSFMPPSLSALFIRWMRKSASVLVHTIKRRSSGRPAQETPALPG